MMLQIKKIVKQTIKEHFTEERTNRKIIEQEKKDLLKKQREDDLIIKTEISRKITV